MKMFGFELKKGKNGSQKIYYNDKCVGEREPYDDFDEVIFDEPEYEDREEEAIEKFKNWMPKTVLNKFVKLAGISECDNEFLKWLFYTVIEAGNDAEKAFYSTLRSGKTNPIQCLYLTKQGGLSTCGGYGNVQGILDYVKKSGGTMVYPFKTILDFVVA